MEKQRSITGFTNIPAIMTLSKRGKNSNKPIKNIGISLLIVLTYCKAKTFLIEEIIKLHL